MFRLSKKSKGVTLVEIVVALTMFSLLIVAAINIFVSVIKAQRKIIAVQTVQESARHVLETMSKDLRYGWVITGDTNLLSVPEFDLCSLDENGDPKKITYKVVSGRLRREPAGSELDLTPTTINEVFLAPFIITDGGAVDNMAVKKLSANFKFQYNTVKEEEDYSLQFRTVLTSRMYGTSTPETLCNP